MIPKLHEVTREVQTVSTRASKDPAIGGHGTAGYVMRLAVWPDGVWAVDYGDERQMAGVPHSDYTTAAPWIGREKVGGGRMSTACAQLTAERLLTQVSLDTMKAMTGGERKGFAAAPAFMNKLSAVSVYRLNDGKGGVSKTIPSLAGAYRLAEKIADLPVGAFVEVLDAENGWQKIGPNPRRRGV